jgi:DNA gyrase/topoisomerase IV subunit A
MEPVHFLPLVPIALINPSEGIAVGFASNILPRRLDEVIDAQIAVLKNKKITSKLIPHFEPLNQTAVSAVDKGDDKVAYTFVGTITRKDSTTCTITSIPYGQTYPSVLAKLDSLLESGTVLDVIDNSKNVVNIVVKFKRGTLTGVTDDQLLKMLGLVSSETENLNVLDFTGQNVWSTRPEEFIKDFTMWRLGWFSTRYERLKALLEVDLSKLYDIRLAIKHNVGGKAPKLAGRAALKELLQSIGVANVDYIADLSIYRFTEEERLKNEKRIEDALELMEEYDLILSSDEVRREIYIDELKDIQTKYKKGTY